MKCIDKKKTKKTKQEKNGKSTPQERRVVGKNIIVPHILEIVFKGVNTYRRE
jgi:hypothetical protein